MFSEWKIGDKVWDYGEVMAIVIAKMIAPERDGIGYLLAVTERKEYNILNCQTKTKSEVYSVLRLPECVAKHFSEIIISDVNKRQAELKNDKEATKVRIVEKKTNDVDKPNARERIAAEREESEPVVDKIVRIPIILKDKETDKPVEKAKIKEEKVSSLFDFI